MTEQKTRYKCFRGPDSPIPLLDVVGNLCFKAGNMPSPAQVASETNRGSVLVLKTDQYDYVYTKWKQNMAAFFLWNPYKKWTDIYTVNLDYMQTWAVDSENGYVEVSVGEDGVYLYVIKEHPYLYAKYKYTWSGKYISGLVYPPKVNEMAFSESPAYNILWVWSPEWDTDNGVTKNLADPQKHDGSHLQAFYVYKDLVYTGNYLALDCNDTHWEIIMAMEIRNGFIYALHWECDIVEAETLGYVYPLDPVTFAKVGYPRYLYDHRTLKTSIIKYDLKFNEIERTTYADDADFAWGGDSQWPLNLALKKYKWVEIERFYNDASPWKFGHFYGIPIMLHYDSFSNRYMMDYDMPQYFRSCSLGEEEDLIIPFQAAIDDPSKLYQFDGLGCREGYFWYWLGHYFPVGIPDTRGEIHKIDPTGMKDAVLHEYLTPDEGYYTGGTITDDKDVK